MNDMTENERDYYERSLRHQAMEWAASTANGSFLHPDVVIERAETFLSYVRDGQTGSIAVVGGEVEWTSPTISTLARSMSSGSARVTNDYPLQARKLVFDQIVEKSIANPPRFGPPVPDDFHLSEVYVVWFCKTLQNWKALISTTTSDGLYWEVTYDGDRHTAYIDQYVKQTNTSVQN